MAVVTSNAEFERLIALRLAEAELLLGGGQWDGAYYLAGYAVEFAPKIRIISDLIKSDGFPDKSVFDTFYRHDLNALLKKFASSRSQNGQLGFSNCNGMP